jgi:hypothetical protein
LFTPPLVKKVGCRFVRGCNLLQCRKKPTHNTFANGKDEISSVQGTARHFEGEGLKKQHTQHILWVEKGGSAAGLFVLIEVCEWSHTKTQACCIYCTKRQGEVEGEG